MPKYKVPLLNGKPNLATELQSLKSRRHSNVSMALETENHCVIKPERDLGAGYISDAVARKRNVNLCDFCWRKYYGFWKSESYRPDWDYRWLTDCMGCSTMMVLCVSFYPEDMFYKVLTENHGRYPEPNRKFYSDI